MTDSIQLYAPSSNTPFLTLASATLTLSVDEAANAWYQGASGPTQVETVKATLSSSQLTLTLTPQRGADLSQFTWVTGEPVTSNVLVIAGLSWSQSSDDLVVACLTPATSETEYKWTFTNQVPPVALKVNIRRQ